MKTQERLTGAYKNAKKIEIDDHSKYIIFSDIHRGDDSISDEFARNQTLMVSALQYYYDKGYTYIEAGDGDELWEHASFKHIRAAHSDVFTVLKEFYKENRFIMLYGNHNICLKNRIYVAMNYYYFYDEYTEKEEELFVGIEPVESVRLTYKPTNLEILILHGHQGDFFNDQGWFLSMFALRYFWKFMHLVGFRNPASPAKNQFKRHKIEKNFSKWILKHRVALICGHTHRMKIPKPNQLPYFNTGCCIHTRGITGIEIINGKILQVQWRVHADRDGTLKIQRKIIKDAIKIKDIKLKRKL